MIIKNFKEKYKNPALDYWAECVENIIEDRRISPLNMADFHDEVSGFLLMLKEQDDLRRIFLDREEHK